MQIGGVGINQLWQCQSDISTDHAQSQINLITKRKSSWDFIIYSRANPTFPIVKYRSFLFLFLLPIHYNVNKGCGTTVNDMVLPLFPFTCVYILFLCTLWPYVRLAFPKFVVTDPPNADATFQNTIILFFSTSDAGSQYRCGWVDRGVQPPFTTDGLTDRPTKERTDKPLIELRFCN